MAKKKRKLDVLDSLDRMVGNDPKLRAMIEEETLYAEIASLVYRAREAAGLTQAQLAKLVGTTQPGIARLEDADYGPRSVAMLQRVAAALNRRLDIRLLPVRRKRSAA